jgi:predicted nucleotidyltransferase component of viral defense system
MTQPINPATLQEMAQDLGVDPLALERDWVLTEIIYHLAQQPLGQELVLKGGQALRHVYGSDRFSKDVDYVAHRRVDFADLRDLLSIRYPRLRPPAEPPESTRFGLKIDPITYTGPLRIPGTVEVEVSFREKIQRTAHSMAFISPFREPFPVAVMDLHEMIAEKVRAMVQRGNPRDLYELWFIFSRVDTAISADVVAELIPRKFPPSLVSKGWRPQDLYTKIRRTEPEWTSALAVLIAEPPTFDDALAVVEKSLRPIIRKVRTSPG